VRLPGSGPARPLENFQLSAADPSCQGDHLLGRPGGRSAPTRTHRTPSRRGLLRRARRQRRRQPRGSWRQGQNALGQQRVLLSLLGWPQVEASWITEQDVRGGDGNRTHVRGIAGPVLCRRLSWSAPINLARGPPRGAKSERRQAWGRSRRKRRSFGSARMSFSRPASSLERAMSSTLAT